jgi:hypothetical protein
MAEAHTQVLVDVLPDCDLCGSEGKTGVPAQYDAKTTYGPWGNLCQQHFDAVGIGLGLGRGQMLVLR